MSKKINKFKRIFLKETCSYFIIFKTCNKSEIDGFVETTAKDFNKLIEQIFYNTRNAKKNPWIWSRGIDEEGNYNNTTRVIKSTEIDSVIIFKNKNSYIEYRKENPKNKNYEINANND